MGDKMLAMELSGAHIKRKVRITWRRKTWPKTQPDEVTELTIRTLVHNEKGDVAFNRSNYSGAHLQVAWNSSVELLD